MLWRSVLRTLAGLMIYRCYESGFRKVADRGCIYRCVRRNLLIERQRKKAARIFIKKGFEIREFI